MYKLLALFALFGFAAAGIVTPVERCGGTGQPVQLRISEHEGPPPCDFFAGVEYRVEGDFIPVASSSGVSLRLIVRLIEEGIEVPILDAAADGAIEAGRQYTIRYDLTPDAFLAGRQVILKLQIYHSERPADMEICVQALSNIHPAIPIP